jgi:hypothetical protein
MSIWNFRFILQSNFDFNNKLFYYLIKEYYFIIIIFRMIKEVSERSTLSSQHIGSFECKVCMNINP